MSRSAYENICATHELTGGSFTTQGPSCADQLAKGFTALVTPNAALKTIDPEGLETECEAHDERQSYRSQDEHTQGTASKPRGLISTLWRRGRRAMAQWQEHIINRQAFQHMLALDDHELRDIGVTRDAVQWASKLPLHINAADALRESMKSSNCNW